MESLLCLVEADRWDNLPRSGKVPLVHNKLGHCCLVELDEDNNIDVESGDHEANPSENFPSCVLAKGIYSHLQLDHSPLEKKSRVFLIYKEDMIFLIMWEIFASLCLHKTSFTNIYCREAR